VAGGCGGDEVVLVAVVVSIVVVTVSGDGMVRCGGRVGVLGM
ncbi:hypothetical protein Tco_0716409, partial [Tanacetum coccineum]